MAIFYSKVNKNNEWMHRSYGMANSISLAIHTVLYIQYIQILTKGWFSYSSITNTDFYRYGCDCGTRTVDHYIYVPYAIFLHYYLLILLTRFFTYTSFPKSHNARNPTHKSRYMYLFRYLFLTLHCCLLLFLFWTLTSHVTISTLYKCNLVQW